MSEKKLTPRRDDETEIGTDPENPNRYPKAKEALQQKKKGDEVDEVDNLIKEDEEREERERENLNWNLKKNEPLDLKELKRICKEDDLKETVLCNTLDKTVEDLCNKSLKKGGKKSKRTRKRVRKNKKTKTKKTKRRARRTRKRS